MRMLWKLAIAAAVFVGVCSIGRAQTWSITDLTCALDNQLTGSDYSIQGNPCTTQVGGYLFQWMLTAGAYCAQQCDPSAYFWPVASMTAYAGKTLPCPNEVWVSFEGFFITSPDGQPGVEVSASGYVAGNPQWTLVGSTWQDCNGNVGTPPSKEQTCGTIVWWDLL
ncbi:MAG TPA: hypothetical protein VMB34_26375 [Acetobacteraceae bacterium]|nr:hypothetical protein [Acetobacteraceae bacterium]